MTSLRRAECQLASGLAVTVATVAVFPLVVVGLLGFLTAPAALVLLLRGAIQARDDSIAASRAGAGLALIVAGLALLGAAAARACTLGFIVTMHRLHPAALAPSWSAWVALLSLCLAAAIAFAAGLVLRACWPSARIAAWGGAVFTTPLLGFVSLLVAAHIWPIGA